MKILAIFLPLPFAASATIVTTATDEGDGGLGKGTGISLREAVEYSPAGTTITFAPALSGKTIRLSLGEIPIDKSLTIDASALPSPSNSPETRPETEKLPMTLFFYGSPPVPSPFAHSSSPMPTVANPPAASPSAVAHPAISWWTAALSAETPGITPLPSTP